MKNLILSTAGHIDHGKTKLVEALTGKNTLHHKEEKQRGITIDLGYAHLSSSDMTIGIIDVPGHEDYLKNSICGILNSDFSLLVVSAKDGIEKQTLEHLKVIEACSIQTILLVITKTDLASLSEEESVEKAVHAMLSSSSLTRFQILSVDYRQPLSLERVRNALFEMGRTIPPSRPAPSFFTIDNAFHLKGHGCVVSGNLLSGSFSSQNSVCLYPSKKEAKIKQIQQNTLPLQEALARGRYAFNLPALSTKDVKRGMVLSTSASLISSPLLDVFLPISKLAEKKCRPHAVVRVYIGTLATTGKIVPLDGYGETGEGYKIVQVRLKEEVTSFLQAPLLLQDTGSDDILGGGYVLHPHPRKKSRLPEKSLALPIGSLLLYNLIYDAHFLSKDRIENSYFLSSSWIDKTAFPLLKEGFIVSLPEKEGESPLYVEGSFWEKTRKKVLLYLDTFFQKRERTLSFSSLSSLFSYVDEKILRFFLKNSPYLLSQGRISLPRQGKSEGERRKIESIHSTLLSSKQPIALKALLEKEGISLSLLYEELRPDFVSLSKDYICSTLLVDSYLSCIREHFARKDTLSLSDFKSYTGLSRKMAVLVLEYFDAKRITKRFENYRIKSYNEY